MQEILAVARSIKDELNPAALSLSGARLLKLLEPFLESLVPVEVISLFDMYPYTTKRRDVFGCTFPTIKRFFEARHLKALLPVYGYFHHKSILWDVQGVFF